MAAVLSLSLALPVRAQGFFPGDAPPPDIGLAAEPVGFGTAAPVAAAAPVVGTSALGLGLLVGLAAAAGAVGGGGGDGGGGGGIVPLDGCTTPDTGRGSFETAEYHASGGLGVVCAADRFARGSFGAGVNVGVFDDGFYAYHQELRHAFRTTSGDNWTQVYDGYTTVPNWTTEGNHGTHVAGIIAAARDGLGMQGIAPGVTLFGLRVIADPGREAFERYNGYNHEDEFGYETFGDIRPDEVMVSDGFYWAYNRNVRVMNHSWGLTEAGPNPNGVVTIDDAGGMEGVLSHLRPLTYSAFRATIEGGSITRLALGIDPDADPVPTEDAWYLTQTDISGGMVHVFAAGNAGHDQPSVLAGLAFYGGAESALAAHTITVVSVAADGTISNFSNRCGRAMDFCMAAPGGDIYSTVERVSADPNTLFDTYEVMSGTSMAAPHVTGAVALLLGEFPSITGADALTILKQTATDLGAPGVDEVYGHGLLNLSGAMQPVGTTSIQLASTVGEDARSVAASGVVAQGAVARSMAATLGTQRMIVTDSFARGFSVDPGAFVTETDDSAALLDRATDFATSAGKILRHSDAAGEIRFSPWGAEALAPGGTLGDVHAPQIGVLGGSAAMAMTAPLGGGFSGTLHFAGPAGGAGSAATEARYLGGTLALAVAPGAEITLGAGLLREEGGFLGADLEGGFGTSVDAETAFLSLGAAVDLGASALRISYTDGTTGFTGDGVLRGGSDVGTRSLGLSWETGVAGGGRFGLGVRRALDVTGGTLDVMMPVARVAASGPVASSTVVMARTDVPLQAAEAPTDLELRYTLPAGQGRLGLAVTHRVEDGTTVAGLGYRMRF